MTDTKQEKNVLVIGNGFDLSLGLKTSYKDFIQSNYFSLLVKNNNSLALYLNEKQEINNWVDIEKELTEYSKQIQDDKSKVKNDFKELKNALIERLVAETANLVEVEAPETKAE